MKKNISVSLGNYYESFIEKKIRKGRYENADELIRAGLRLLELEEDKASATKASAYDGFCDTDEDFDAEKFMDSLDLGDEFFVDEKKQAAEPDRSVGS